MPESGAARKEAQRAIRRGVELGMTHLDTAEMYGAGRVEELLGEAIRGIAREKLFIATKVLPSNASYRGTLAAAEASLARLRCEYLDLYLLHWPGSHPLEETMRAFDALRRARQDSFRRREQLRGRRDDRGGIVSAQGAAGLQSGPLSPLRARYRARADPGGRARGIAIVAYTPFGRGAFLRAGARRRETLERIARKHGATLRQVALAFLTREPDVFAIPKAAPRGARRRECRCGRASSSTRRTSRRSTQAFPRERPRAAGNAMMTTIDPAKSRKARSARRWSWARARCASHRLCRRSVATRECRRPSRAATSRRGATTPSTLDEPAIRASCCGARAASSASPFRMRRRGSSNERSAARTRLKLRVVVGLPSPVARAVARGRRADRRSRGRAGDGNRVRYATAWRNAPSRRAPGIGLDRKAHEPDRAASSARSFFSARSSRRSSCRRIDRCARAAAPARAASKLARRRRCAATIRSTRTAASRI